MFMPIACATSQEVWLADGREIAHATTLDLRSLKQGTTTLRVFLRAGDNTLNKSWTIVRSGDRFTLVSEGDQHPCESPPEQPIHPHPKPGC